MTSDNNKFILYGGPEPDNIGEGCKSLGEFLIKKLTENGDRVALVSSVWVSYRLQ